MSIDLDFPIGCEQSVTYVDPGGADELVFDVPFVPYYDLSYYVTNFDPNCDWSSFRVGALEFPITGSTTYPTIVDMEPVVVSAQNFWLGELNNNLLDRWNATVQKAINDGVGTAELQKLSGSFIRDVYSNDPYLFLNEAEFKFPLLAVYKVRDDYSYRTLQAPRTTCKAALDIIFPPLNFSCYQRLVPFLHAASTVIWERTEQGYDGNLGGNIPWFEQVSEVGFTSSQVLPGIKASSKGNVKANLWMPVLHMEWTYTQDKRYTVTGSLTQATGFDACITSTSPNGPDTTPFSGSFNGTTHFSSSFYVSSSL